MPSALRLLVRLAATQDRMRGDLLHKAQRVESSAPTFPEFTLLTRVKSFLEGLTAETTADAIAALTSLSEAERERLVELRAVLASSAARSTRADADAARQDASQARSLASTLRRLSETVHSGRVDEVRTRALETGRAQEAVDVAAREFAGLPLSGIGAESWRRLWDAARAFSESVAVGFPPLVSRITRTPQV